MRYLPKSPLNARQMLAEIGATSIDDLFASHSRRVPPDARP